MVCGQQVIDASAKIIVVSADLIEPCRPGIFGDLKSAVEGLLHSYP